MTGTQKFISNYKLDCKLKYKNSRKSCIKIDRTHWNQTKDYLEPS